MDQPEPSWLDFDWKRVLFCLAIFVIFNLRGANNRPGAAGLQVSTER